MHGLEAAIKACHVRMSLAALLEAQGRLNVPGLALLILGYKMNLVALFAW